MLTLRAGRQPQRRAGTSGRPVRRASENATKVPLSKKCKLDIKRKHLRAAIPGCLAVNSYAVNLQLQIDGEKLPDLYKCTIKKHVNNKTSCVSYRLQGTGIYNHLRGLYMRGFSCGEEPGVVVLVASRQAAPDLSYSVQSDGEDADCAGAECAAANDDTDSEAERRQQRQRRQQRPRRQRKRRREDSDEEDVENDRFGDVETKDEVIGRPAGALPVTGPSSHHPGFYQEIGAEAALTVHQFQQHQFQHVHAHMHTQFQHVYHEHRHQRLRSHPVQAFDLSPNGEQVEGFVGIHAHTLSAPGDDSAALVCHEHPHDDAVSTLNAACVEAEFVAAVTEAERRTGHAGSGPGPGSSLDPFDHLALGVNMGSMAFGGGLVDSNSLVSNAVPGHPSCLVGPGLLGPDAGVCDATAAAQLQDGVGIIGAVETDGGGLQNAVPALPPGFAPQRDPLLDLPLTLSPFSPRLLQELTGRPHLPRVGGHQPPSQLINGWGALPLDFDNAWPRQHLTWPDSLGLGL